MAKSKKSSSLIAENRKARKFYDLIEFFEAGIVLTGPEVKSMREGHVHFGDSYVDYRNGEAFLLGLHIAPYARAGYVKQEPERERKLLLHSSEIRLLTKQVEQKGLTTVPLKFYFKEGKIKLEIALAKGRKLFDQREVLKQKAENRDAQRELVRH